MLGTKVAHQNMFLQFGTDICRGNKPCQVIHELSVLREVEARRYGDANPTYEGFQVCMVRSICVTYEVNKLHQQWTCSPPSILIIVASLPILLIVQLLSA